MDYCYHILIYIALFTVLGTSLNLVTGYAGLVSLCHAAFWGMGAYLSALLCLDMGLPWLIAQLVGLLGICLVSTLLGLACLRFRQDYFVVSTLAFQVVVFGLMRNWSSVTGGPLGIAHIPSPVILWWKVDSTKDFMLLSLGLCCVSLAVVARLARSPYGLSLKSVREDETVSTAMGKNVAGLRISAFVVSACLAGLAGGLYASYVSFIEPGSFTLHASMMILAIVVIGGSGSVMGPFFGASLLVLLPEVLRIAGLSSSTAANVRQILYGTALTAFMMLRPHGLVGRCSFDQPASEK